MKILKKRKAKLMIICTVLYNVIYTVLDYFKILSPSCKFATVSKNILMNPNMKAMLVLKHNGLLKTYVIQVLKRAVSKNTEKDSFVLNRPSN